MNSEQFYEEVVSKYKMTSEFKQMFDGFKQYQTIAFNTLKEFHKVCKMNGIEYQLIYGSLLGAIRDHGQIPWDYDVDVFVKYDDRKKLIDALERDLCSDYYYESVEKDPKYPHVFTRVTASGYDSERLHVDVFYTVGAPNNEADIKSFSDELAHISLSYFYKTIRIIPYANGNLKRLVKLAYEKAKRIFDNPERLYKNYIDLCGKYNQSDSNYCVSADQYSSIRYYDYSELWSLSPIMLNGDEYLISANCEKLLEETYGDYMSYPSLDKRIKELKSSYRSLCSAKTR